MLSLIRKSLIVLIPVLLISTTVIQAEATPSSQYSTDEMNNLCKNWTKYQRGNYEQNCLSYALGMSDLWWEWPVGWGTFPSEATVKTYLKNQKGYKTFGTSFAGPLNPNYIVAYYTTRDGGYIAHFAKHPGSGTSIRGKMGHYEIYTHAYIDCFKAMSPKFTAWK